jgi:NAD(P)-dependent dehydrogenase (short-subunit alcohol dehydrogenase family)
MDRLEAEIRAKGMQVFARIGHAAGAKGASADAGRASVILNASIVASRALGANSVYSATKAALRSFARTWTIDLKDRHIRVNAVSPGFTDTPGLRQLMPGRSEGQQRWKMMSDSIPLGRAGTPLDIEGRWCFSHPTTAAHHRNGIVCGWRFCTSVDC